MSAYTYSLGQKTYRFTNLTDVMAKASSLKSGDVLAGLAAETDEQRVAAQMLLANIPLKRFVEEPLIPPEVDAVTRLSLEQLDTKGFSKIENKTVGEFRNSLLDYSMTSVELAQLSNCLLPEMVAAASKLSRNQDLILVASKCQVITQFRNTLGLSGRLATRLQPNHPTDDAKGIGAAMLDGLMYGCGDAVIGINPATDSLNSVMRLLSHMDELITRFDIPTQSCVLAHVTTQLEAIKRDAPVDLVFQSIAGTQAANESFGVDMDLLNEAHQAAQSLKRGTVGQHVMYFETGQGSCLSAQAHHGVDQQTLEARAYGVAKKFNPLLVNSVVGFIGPEYLYDGKQIARAGLEDHFCGKLLGLPMGCDVCYTNHAEADQDDMDNLLTLLGVAGCNFFMGLPGADDIMLNYQSTSFHDAEYLRQVLGKKPAPEFEAWLQKMNIIDGSNTLLPVTDQHPLLLAQKGVEKSL